MTQQNIMALLQNAAQAFQRGDFPTALAHSETALGQMPGHPEALHLKALALGRLGRVDEALPAFDAAAAAHPARHAILANKGNALRAVGRNAEARAAYEASLAANAGFLPAILSVARLYIDDHQFEPAEEVLSAALRAAPQNPGLLNELGVLRVQQGRHGDAVTYFSQALAGQPNMLEALVNRGAAYKNIGEHDRGLSDLQAAVALAPDHPEAQYQLADILRQKGNFADAEKHYDKALAVSPTRTDIHRDYARMLWEGGGAETFLAPLDRAIAHTPLAPLHVLKSELALRAGFIDVAMTAAQGALALEPTEPAALRALGRAQRHLGVADAVPTLQRALSEAPEDFATLHELAEVYLARGEIGQAVDLLKGDAPPEHLQAHIALKTTAMRLSGDNAYQNYYDYDRFTRKMMLQTPPGYASLEAFNEALLAALRPLHAMSVRPIDQTLFGGTQSTGRLWDEPSPVFAALKSQLLAAAAEFVDSLPYDPNHPFLARKSRNLECAGAWSVILKDGGGHVDHFHPEGWISASYYVRVPEEVIAGEREGFLRLGKPGVAGVDLPGEKWFRPESGAIVFFPSYMWHGVEPFLSRSERVTAPFDLRPVNG